MGLKENLEWGEKAVAEVKRNVQYASANQKGDLVGAYMGAFEKGKARALEQEKLDRQAAMIGSQASVADKVSFFNRAATSPLAPRPQAPGPRLDVFQLPNPLYDRMDRVRGGQDQQSLTNSAYSWYLNQGYAQDFHTLILAESWAAKLEKCGNCGELAAIAFQYLEGQKVRPVDYMYFSRKKLRPEDPVYDHAWIVIGLAAGLSKTQTHDVNNWGEDAVWCDPWQMREGRVYSVRDLIKGKVTGLDARYFLDTYDRVNAGLPESLYRSN